MIRYSDELIDEIKNNNDIVDVVSQYVHLKRSGRNYFGLCPFHNEKSPSFAVSPDKQIFHCFGCGVGGNVIHFISKIEGINYRESIELLAERANITLPKLESIGDNKTQELKDKIYQINKEAAYFYHENLYKPTAKPAQEYVKKRKLNRNHPIWGCSSVGRAPALQAGGQEFESLRLHRRCNKTVTVDIVP